MSRPPPFRRFTHPDGRAWEIRQHGAAVELQITSEGETVKRRRSFDGLSLAAADVEQAVREQLAEGFTEQTPPEWRRRVDELVVFWESDDPGFDADVLRSQFFAAGDALAQQAMAHLGSWEKGQSKDPELARAWLKANLDAVLCGVLLALRYADAQVLLRVDALLAEAPRPEVIEALLSVVEHPTPADPEEDGGRPWHLPLGALLGLGKPDSETALRLFHCLEADDLRVRDTAAAVLAEHSLDDGFFAALWSRKTLLRQSDGTCWAVLRVAEVRRAPELRDFLMWMQKSARFKTPAYGKRIGDALAHLRNR